MSWPTYLLYLVVMAGVTYLIRMLPLTVFRKEIKSVFIKINSFLLDIHIPNWLFFLNSYSQSPWIFHAYRNLIQTWEYFSPSHLIFCQNINRVNGQTVTLNRFCNFFV